MKTPLSFVQMLMFAVAFSVTLKATATDHAVTVFAASPKALVRLAEHLPRELQLQLTGLATQAMGPLLVASSQEAPVGVWLDWKSDTPQFVLMVRDADINTFNQSTRAAGIEPKLHANDVHELTMESPIFYRQQAEWLYVATSMDELQNLDDPMRTFPNGIDHDVMVQANLSQIPQGVRTELAKVVGKRLLPPAVAAPNEVSGDTLVHLYASRLLNELATLTETLSITVDHEEKGLVVNADVDSRRLSQFVNRSPKAPLPGLKEMTQGLTLHTSLADEEVARLTWWTQSIPEQVAAAFRVADIEQRSGDEGIVQMATLCSRLLRETTQSGEIEAFVTLLDDEEQTPIIGAVIKSGDEFEKKLRQWVNSGHAAELEIKGVEYDLEQIGALRVSRITVGEDGESPLPLIIAIANDRMFLTIGQTGIDGLRDLVSRTSAETEVPKPIQLRLNHVSLASLLGWEGSADSMRTLELDSRYTKDGKHYELRLLKK